MLTQIYEISTPEEARTISEIGVDHIGILEGKGEFPRELPVEAAAEVAAGIVPPSKFSALFLTGDLALIEDWALELRPDIVHLSAAPGHILNWFLTDRRDGPPLAEWPHPETLKRAR